MLVAGEAPDEDLGKGGAARRSSPLERERGEGGGSGEGKRGQRERPSREAGTRKAAERLALMG